MKLGYNWLKEFVDIDISVNELSDKLTMAGIEVEGIEELSDGEKVMELSLTPNRSDCLSVLGVAREVSALCGYDLKSKHINTIESEEPVSESISLSIEEPDLCLRYSARVIKDVKVGPSPKWLILRLESAGFKSINNVVDITNLVMMELGHPLHAFDYNKIDGKKIIVRYAKAGEKFSSLDNSEYNLTDDMLVIADERKPVALAGVVGGSNSEVTSVTKDILLEAAYFNPSTVRKTARRLGVHTESSHRFERGVDYECVIKSINMAASLINEIAGGNINKGICDCVKNKVLPNKLTLRVDRTNKILGINIGKPDIETYLSKLSFLVKNVEPDKSLNTIAVEVPTFRRDIEREIDLIEEVARVHGYNNISSDEPYCRVTGKDSNSLDLVKGLKDILIAKGFSEVVNYSFVSKNVYEKINLYKEGEDFINIKNPLSGEWDIMRTTIIPSLISNVSSNIKKGNNDIKFFEAAKVFYGKKEEMMFSCVLTSDNDKNLWSENGDKRTFYDIKGALDVVLSYLRVKEFRVLPSKHTLFSGSCGAKVLIGNVEVGKIGEVRRSVCDVFDIDSKVFTLEVNLDKICSLASDKIKFSMLPKYPSVTRDAAFIVDRFLSSDEIIHSIEESKPVYLEDVFLFDYYEGKSIPKNKKSMAYSLVYRAKDKTLTDDEVDLVHEGIIERLKENLNVSFRD